MLQLDVSALKRAPGNAARFDLSAELPPHEAPGGNLFFPVPVRASLVVSNTGSMIVVEGEVSGKVSLHCDRCLELYDYHFQAPVQETYMQAVQNSGSEAVPLSGDLLDITPEIMKGIILSLPMKTVCRDDCRGLCPQCGCNLNKGQCNCTSTEIDPRLSVLKDFFNHNNNR